MRILWIGLLAAAGVAAAGCSPAQVRHMSGEQTKRDIYLNLMTPEQAARFRELEAAWVDDERLVLYCQEIGVWQAWRAATPEHQELIRRREIAAGMSAAEVRMAWGPPAARWDVATAADRAEGRQRVLWGYDPNETGDGSDDESDRQAEPPADPAVYRRQVALLDGVVLWFRVGQDEGLWERMQFWK